MKKIGLLILVVLIMTGCSSEETGEHYFKKISTEHGGYVVYDIRTGVQYWMSNSGYNLGSLTLLVDETGKPLTYDGLEVEYE